MKKLLFLLTLFSVIILVGCGGDSGTGGVARDETYNLVFSDMVSTKNGVTFTADKHVAVKAFFDFDSDNSVQVKVTMENETSIDGRYKYEYQETAEIYEIIMGGERMLLVPDFYEYSGPVLIWMISDSVMILATNERDVNAAKRALQDP